jgi:predicted Zn-dependent protease
MTGPEISPLETEREEQRLSAKAKEYKSKQLDRVRSVGARILAEVDDKHRKIRFEIEDSDSVNAGASFGKIVVTYGMIRFLKSDDELAVVLGHELAHIVQGHVTRGFVKGVLLEALGAVAQVQLGGGGRAIAALGSALTMGFDRDQEREADNLGLQYASRAGYDPRVGVEIWERFAVENPRTITKDFLSNHPSSPERLLKAKKIADWLPPSTLLTSRSNEVDLQLTPTGCDLAVKQFSRAWNASSGEERIEHYRRGLAICPDDYAARVDLAELYLERGNDQYAEEELREALHLAPDYPRAQRGLERIELIRAELSNRRFAEETPANDAQEGRGVE